MKEKRFWSENTNAQQGDSRNLENHLANPSQDHSTRLRRKVNNYDPWADWFNTGLEPEPLNDNFNPQPVPGSYSGDPNVSMEPVADNFGAQPEYTNNPLFYAAEPTQSNAWDQVYPSAYPTAEYPVTGGEALEQTVDDDLPAATEPEHETTHLVWREFPEKSC